MPKSYYAHTGSKREKDTLRRQQREERLNRAAEKQRAWFVFRKMKAANDTGEKLDWSNSYNSDKNKLKRLSQTLGKGILKLWSKNIYKNHPWLAIAKEMWTWDRLPWQEQDKITARNLRDPNWVPVRLPTWSYYFTNRAKKALEYLTGYWNNATQDPWI